MSKGWDFDSSPTNKQEFTKFPVGITHIRILDDAPHHRWTHWLPNVTKDGKGRSVNCPGRDCPICDIIKRQKANKEKVTHSQAKRIAINVYNQDTNRLEIMEQGKTFFEDIRDIREDLKLEGKTLRDAILKVRRRGTGKEDTSYRIDVAEIKELSPAEQVAMQEKVNLDEYFSPTPAETILRLIKGEKWEDVFSQEETEEKPEKEEEIEIE